MELSYNYQLPELTDLQLKDFCKENDLEISRTSMSEGYTISLKKIVEIKSGFWKDRVHKVPAEIAVLHIYEKQKRLECYLHKTYATREIYECIHYKENIYQLDALKFIAVYSKLHDLEVVIKL